MVADASNFVQTLEASPAFKTDVAALLPYIPTDVLEEASSDPEALLEELSSDTDELPAWVSAIPTSVLASLETLAAEPLEAASDVEDYVEDLIDEPDVTSALGVLQTAVPTSVQAAIESDPVEFLEDLVTASALPAWVTDIAAPLQSEIGSVINGALTIVAEDLEGSALPSAFATGYLPSAASGFSPQKAYATGTGIPSVVASNGSVATGTPAASPAPFEGAASGTKGVTVGMTVLITGIGFLVTI